MIDWAKQEDVKRALYAVELEVRKAMGVCRDAGDQDSLRACLRIRDDLSGARREVDDLLDGRSVVENDAIQAEQR